MKKSNEEHEKIRKTDKEEFNQILEENNGNLVKWNFALKQQKFGGKVLNDDRRGLQESTFRSTSCKRSLFSVFFLGFMTSSFNLMQNNLKKNT